ncbi:MAG: VPLPA-CTERM sorting domain-containing protein [Pseudomonadota bacterium]
MRVFKSLTCAGILAVLGLTLGQAKASTILNGSFDDGLNGYSLEATGAAVAATSLATVATTSLGNNFLSLEARPATGGFGVSATQTITIDAMMPVLTFDAAMLSEDIILGGTPSNLQDALNVAILPQGAASATSLFLLNNSLTPLVSYTSVSTAPDTVFETSLAAFSVVADLSAYAGQTLDLSFSGFNFESVVTQSFFGVDNIAFSAAPAAAVPLPFSAGLLVTGLFAFGALRRR